MQISVMVHIFLDTHIYIWLILQVDRCVTGLVAQQSCVGCLHTPVADVGVTALSFVDTVCVYVLNFLMNILSGESRVRCLLLVRFFAVFVV